MENTDLFGKVLGKHLRLRRTMNGKTIEDIAAKAGIDSKNLGRNERGEKVPSSETLFKIFAVFTDLDIDFNELIHDVLEELNSFNPPDSD